MSSSQEIGEVITKSTDIVLCISIIHFHNCFVSRWVPRKHHFTVGSSLYTYLGFDWRTIFDQPGCHPKPDLALADLMERVFWETGSMGVFKIPPVSPLQPVKSYMHAVSFCNTCWDYFEPARAGSWPDWFQWHLL